MATALQQHQDNSPSSLALGLQVAATHRKLVDQGQEMLALELQVPNSRNFDEILFKNPNLQPENDEKALNSLIKSAIHLYSTQYISIWKKKFKKFCI